MALTLMAVVAIGGVIGGILMVSDSLRKAATERIGQSRLPLTVSAAAEIAVLGFRLAEIHYIKEGDACGSSLRPFMDAVGRGHGCTGLGTISVFNSGDPTAIGIPPLATFSYARTDCTIERTTGLRCGGDPYPYKLFTMGTTEQTEHQKINKMKFNLYLKGVDAKRSLAMFDTDVIETVTGEDPSAKATERIQKKSFALTNALLNMAHIENDGRVTQSNPNPLSFCPGEPWANMLIFSTNGASRRCLKFVEMGSGTGLAYYAGRFFGFRPADGQVIDLLEGTLSATSTSYLVEENGRLSGGSEELFPPYNKDALTNTDDITTIGNQIYFIAQSGDSAHVGAIGPSATYKPPAGFDIGGAPSPPYHRLPLCPLGKMGWSQSYSGLAAAGWSDPLLPTNPEDTRLRTALMFAKTDNGDFLSLILLVTKDPGGTTPNNCSTFSVSDVPFRSCCYVTKNQNLQEIEFSRTYGFDRADPVKPFYVQ